MISNSILSDSPMPIDLQRTCIGVCFSPKLPEYNTMQQKHMHCTGHGYLHVGKLLVQCKVQGPTCMAAIFGPYLNDPVREH